MEGARGGGGFRDSLVPESRAGPAGGNVREADGVQRGACCGPGRGRLTRGVEASHIDEQGSPATPLSPAVPPPGDPAPVWCWSLQAFEQEALSLFFFSPHLRTGLERGKEREGAERRNTWDGTVTEYVPDWEWNSSPSLIPSASGATGGQMLLTRPAVHRDVPSPGRLGRRWMALCLAGGLWEEFPLRVGGRVSSPLPIGRCLEARGAAQLVSGGGRPRPGSQQGSDEIFPGRVSSKPLTREFPARLRLPSPASPWCMPAWRPASGCL